MIPFKLKFRGYLFVAVDGGWFLARYVRYEHVDVDSESIYWGFRKNDFKTQDDTMYNPETCLKYKDLIRKHAAR